MKLKYILSALLKGCSSIGFLLYNFTLIYMYGKEDAGILIAVFSLLLGLSILAKFGFEGVIIRNVGAFSGLDRLLIKRILSVCLILIIAIFISIHYISIALEDRLLIFIADYNLVFLVPVFAFLGLSSAYIKGLKQPAIGLIVEPGNLFVLLSITAFAYHSFINQDLSSYVYSILPTTLIITVIYSILLLSLFRAIKGKPEGNWIKEPIGFLGFEISSYVTVWLSNIIIYYYFGSQLVAEYSLAFRSAMIINFILVLYNIIEAPTYARYFNRNQIKLSQKLVSQHINKLFVISLILSALLLLFVYISSIIGKVFETDVTVFVLISIGYLVNVYYGPVAMLLNMSGNSYSSMLIASVAAAVYIIVLFILVELVGYYAIPISFILYQVLLNYLLNKKVSASLGLVVRN